ncbi:hypothetical protein [Halorubrum sp. FL23]|uniref:hypothetical protein n=1 Tax=Halorubrum sp. FL23 TaxID=3458704 RepID=UPI004034963A
MSDRDLSTSPLPDEEVDRVDEEANQLGMSRAEYVRKNIHIGRRVMQASGQLDRDFLATVAEDGTEHLDKGMTTSLDDIEDEILDALAADSRRAMSPEAVKEAVFGTEEEQIARIKDALDVLNERGDITITTDAEAYIDD